MHFKDVSLSTFKPRHKVVSSNSVKEDGNTFVQTHSVIHRLGFFSLIRMSS